MPPSSTIISNPHHDQSPVSTEAEIADLRDRLSARERRIRLLESAAETSDDVLAEWQAKYDRLWEAHRKLQKTNHSLEDKLLRVVDKFDADKNAMTRDLASQTQRLVQTKLTITQLRERNAELQSDLRLSVTLLQNKPSSFLAQRVDSLPADMQARVRAHLAEQKGKKSNGDDHQQRKIRVPIMEDVNAADVGEDERVSAAILAKVLEERAKERRKEHKFCIDIGTQTHGWHLSDKSNGNSSSSSSSTSSSSSSSAGKRGQTSSKIRTESGESRETAEVIQILRSISMDDYNKGESPCSEKSSSSAGGANIFMASVIRSPPPSVLAAAADHIQTNHQNNISNKRLTTTPIMRRSATFSATETDL